MYLFYLRVWKRIKKVGMTYGVEMYSISLRNRVPSLLFRLQTMWSNNAESN
jgi:hypothetical protein